MALPLWLKRQAVFHSGSKPKWLHLPLLLLLLLLLLKQHNWLQL